VGDCPAPEEGPDGERRVAPADARLSVGGPFWEHLRTVQVLLAGSPAVYVKPAGT
jgi:hypothetical protein